MPKLLSDELAAAVAELVREELQRQNPVPQPRTFDGQPDTGIPLFLVKGVSAVTAPNSGAFTIYGKLGEDKGSETDIGDDTITVYVRFGDYIADKWGLVASFGSGYEMIITEC